jgi:rare lipoprotein A
MRMKFLAAMLAALFLAGCSTGPARVKPLADNKSSSKVEKDHTVVGLFGYKRARWKGKGPDPFAGKGSAFYAGDGPLPKGGGRQMIGKPYKVAGRWFRPAENPRYDKVGMSSWYGEDFHARKTSNGEYFDMNELTAAHATLPLPSYAKVTNLANGRKIVVRINDRGPFVGTRIIDLSRKSADALGYRRMGKAKVRVQYLGPAPLNDQGSHLQAMNDAVIGGASVASLRQQARNTNPVMIASMGKRRKKNSEPVQQIASSSEALLIQVGVFRNPDNAQSALEQVASLGDSRLVDAKSKGKKAYSVQIGPFITRDEAETALVLAQAKGFVDANIVTAEIQQVSYNQ